MTYQKSLKRFKKVSIFVGIFLLISLVYPVFKAPSAGNISSAADEIRFTKNAAVKSPALGQNFIAWIEYREGAYNMEAYDFKTHQEKKLNKSPLAVDTLGPVVSQSYVYWVDHLPTGWVFTKYDLGHNTLTELKTETNTVYGFNVFENNIVYSAKKGNSTDVFTFDWYNTNSRNLTDDEKYQGVPSIFGNIVAFSEYATACEATLGNEFASTCGLAEAGDVATFDLTSGVKRVLVENAAALSNVKTQYNTLAWSQLVGDKKAVKIYYINTGASFAISPADRSSYNPVLAPDLAVYFVDKPSGTDLEYFKFGTNERGTLSWTKANKSQVSISPDIQKIACLDNRFGSADIFYYDFKADGNVNDQDIDGVSDAIEMEKGSNPYDPDTDHDGLTDYEEIYLYHTYPTQYDSDGDGLTDGEEVKVWFTNPLAFDTDHDGFNDKTEVSNGYSPLSSATIKEPGMIAPQLAGRTYIYGKERLSDLSVEKQYALELKQQLDKKYGQNRWHTNGAREWFKVVNAYVYGGYNVTEIGRYIKGDKTALNSSINAVAWRSSNTFKSAMVY